MLLWYARSQVSNNDHISLSCCWGPIQISRHAKNAKFYPYLPTCHVSVTLGKYPTYLPSRVTVLSQFSAKTHTLLVEGLFSAKRRVIYVCSNTLAAISAICRHFAFTCVRTHIRSVWHKERKLSGTKASNFCTTLSLSLPLLLLLLAASRHADPWPYLPMRHATVTLTPGPTYLGRAWRDIWMVPKAV